MSGFLLDQMCERKLKKKEKNNRKIILKKNKNEDTKSMGKKTKKAD